MEHGAVAVDWIFLHELEECSFYSQRNVIGVIGEKKSREKEGIICV